MVETAYTKPRLRSTAWCRRASLEDGAARKTRSRPVRSDAASQSAPSSGMRSGVMRPLDAVLHDGVPVGHQEHRRVHALRDGVQRVEAVAEAEALRERGLRRALDDGSVHDGVAVRQAELDDVDAVLDQRDGGLDARGHIREADGEVADEGAGSLLAAEGDGPLDGAARGRGGVGGAHDCSAPASMRSK
jgi:hypothetical protein